MLLLRTNVIGHLGDCASCLVLHRQYLFLLLIAMLILVNTEEQ